MLWFFSLHFHADRGYSLLVQSNCGIAGKSDGIIGNRNADSRRRAGCEGNGIRVVATQRNHIGGEIGAVQIGHIQGGEDLLRPGILTNHNCVNGHIRQAQLRVADCINGGRVRNFIDEHIGCVHSRPLALIVKDAVPRDHGFFAGPFAQCFGSKRVD